MTISVDVVDDETLILGSIRIPLNTADDLRVVGEAGDGAGAVGLVAAERPDVGPDGRPRARSGRGGGEPR